MGPFKSLLFLGLCYLVCAQDDRDVTERPVVQCPTAEQLLKGGCTRNCIVLESGGNRLRCPTCTLTDGCNGTDDACSPDNPETCTDDDEICLSVGIGGQYTCVDRIEDGQSCSISKDFIEDVIENSLRLLSNVDARDIVSRLSNFPVPCRRGLVCKTESLTSKICRPENQEGPCFVQRQRDAEAKCDEDGNFEPLQCRRLPNSRLYQCRCVDRNGTMIAVDDFEGEVQDPRDAPDCEDIVNQRCRYRSALGFLYEVRSGETFIDPQTASCARCLCRDGMSDLCESLTANDCRRINPMQTRSSCTVRGRTIPDGTSINVDCNLCKCSNGRFACTRRLCEEDEDEEDDPNDPEEESNCRACANMRADPVCGRDGRTYPSRCFATNCRGLNAGDIIPGPCSRQNVCENYPCEGNEICLKVGGVTCLSSSGCRTDLLRRCEDLTVLRCKRRTEADDDSEEGENNGEEGDEEEDTVCGDDRRTYPNVCNLLQNSVQTQVAYAGRCNRTECSGGEVCGTDGETYANICELQANSANARVDYRGACMDSDPEEVVKDRCRRLRSSERCAALPDCTSRIRPEDGCCPVCGGAVTIGLDREALDEYIRLNPSLETVDDLLKTLISSRFIPQDILQRCMLSADILSTGDLHLVLENVVNSESVCRMFAERIAERINNPPTSDEPDSVDTITAASPQVLQFATVAQTSPLVEESTSVSTPAGSLPGTSVTMMLLLLPIFTLFL